MESSMAEIAKSGKPYKCIYNVSVEGINQDGIVYFAGDKLRGDIKMVLPSVGTKNSHFIKSGNEEYVWADDGGGKGCRQMGFD